MKEVMSVLYTFTKEPIYKDDIVVYLKNENTDNNTTRKYKFIGQVIGFTAATVKIRQLSDADKFVTPEECKDYGEVSVYPKDVVHVVASKHQEDSHTRTLTGLLEIIDKYETELEFTRKFVHEHGLEFALASEWSKYTN